MSSGLHLLPGLVVAATLGVGPVPTAEDGPAAPDPPAGSPRLLREMPVLGVGINAHHIDDLPLYLQSVDAIARLGANTLLLVTPMFQDKVDSSEIRFKPDRCPTREQLAAILQRARGHGLQTVLLPIVLIEFPGEKDWRGVLRPDDLEAWWASYDRFVDYYLDLAVANEVDVLSIGSELNSTEDQPQQWRRIIDRVRERFKGRVTYTANWDRYDKVTFWPMVDFISVSSYFELSRDDPDAPVSRLTVAWGAERSRLLRLARDEGKSILIMELGYPSLPWAAAHPWDYVARDDTPPDHAAQARCYQAFFQAWTETLLRPGSPAIGFNCYYWDPYHRGGANDTGYGVRGKPALELIRKGFGRIRKATEATDAR